MNDSDKLIGSRVTSIGVFVGALWLVYLVDLVLSIDLTQYGLLPRTLTGLIGIPTMTFLHGGFGHLMSNTVPLVILLGILAVSRAHFWTVVAEIIVLGGSLLWLVGRPSYHVGASLLIFGLMSYLIVVGFFEKRIVSILLAIVVFFFFGGSLLWGVLPVGDKGVSWEGHLMGAIAGVAVAYAGARNSSNKLES